MSDINAGKKLWNYEAQRYCLDMGHEFRDGVCVRCFEHGPNFKPGQCEHDWGFHEVLGPGIMPGYPKTTNRTLCRHCGLVFDPDVTPIDSTTTGLLNTPATPKTAEELIHYGLSRAFEFLTSAVSGNRSNKREIAIRNLWQAYGAHLVVRAECRTEEQIERLKLFDSEWKKAKELLYSEGDHSETKTRS